MISDFIEYWAAAKLLIERGNPYSPEELLKVQQAVGWPQAEPLLMWNPPWTLAFTAPLGMLDYGAAQFLWFILHIMVIFVGARVLWQSYGGALHNSWWAPIAALTFAPTYFLLLLGQIGGLILLGLILFLHSVKRRAWWTAGLSLTLVSVKPHLSYLFWLAVVLWALREGRWRFIGGWVVGGFVIGAVPLLFDPSIYSQYLDLIKSRDVTRPFNWATPSLGSAAGELLLISGDWIRWLPSVGGVIWVFWHWRRNADSWEWSREMPIVLLVSVTTASFVWTFDHIVLLPALIQCAAWLSLSENHFSRRWIVPLHMLMNAGVLLVKLWAPNDFWYFWLAPAYLLFYLWARSSTRGLCRAN